MDICSIQNADKQLIARRVGSDLVKKHGKKRHYTVEEIKASARRQLIPDSWDCWALSLYTSPSDFVAYHATTREICDYTDMHGKMVDAVGMMVAVPDIVGHCSSGLGIADALGSSGAPVDLPAPIEPASTVADLATVGQPSGSQGDSSWFFGLLDALETIELPSIDF